MYGVLCTSFYTLNDPKLGKKIIQRICGYRCIMKSHYHSTQCFAGQCVDWDSFSKLLFRASVSLQSLPKHMGNGRGSSGRNKTRMNLIYTHRIHGSIYSTCTYIYFYKHQPDGGKHTSPMDPMGYFWKEL